MSALVSLTFMAADYNDSCKKPCNKDYFCLIYLLHFLFPIASDLMEFLSYRPITMAGDLLFNTL